MKEWTTEETFALISEYKANECLWQKNHRFYKNVKMRNDALKQLAHKFNCNENAINKKWRSLRTIFMERLRKIDKIPTKWKFFKALSFLNSESLADACDPLVVKDTQHSFETNQKRESSIEQYDDEYIPYFKKRKSLADEGDRLSHKIIEWTTEEIFSLINEFKQRKCLWDKLHYHYKRLDKKTEALKEIATKFNWQEKDVKEKLRNLRTNFMKCLRKGKFGVTPRWQFYSALEFLNMESSIDENIKAMDDEDQSVKSYTDSATPTAYYEVIPATSIPACATIDAMIQLPAHCSTAADSSYDIELTDNIKNECEYQSVVSETESATLPMPARMKTKVNDASTTSNSCRAVDDEEGSNLRFEKYEISNVTTTNAPELNGQKYTKFGQFIASTMEVMQDPELEKLTELKIRMILAEMSHKAVKRQLAAFNEADNL